MAEPFTPRVLDAEPVEDLAAYEANGGGKGLEAARRLGPAATIDDVDASGLRGRGGGGFPTGRKWRTVAANRSAALPATVVVNAAEGEPGSFKDHEILRRNPFRVIEGALIAAHAIGADRVVVALKASAEREIQRVRAAIATLTGWADGVRIDVLEGPPEYLYGEETALLEVLEGRAPFPRVAPPYRHGADELGDGTTSAAEVDLAGQATGTEAPPTLVNNVETLANVPGILANGPDWFRSVGTAESPGTIVCTITGDTQRHGVGEFPMGVAFADVVDELGGGAALGQHLVAAMSGVAGSLLPASLFDTPMTIEAMLAAGSALGTAGFIVFDDTTDLVAVAAGASRFLAVESCGQCEPCKDDGRRIAAALERLGRNEPEPADSEQVAASLTTITDGARCYLATQHQLVVTSVLELAPEQFEAHRSGDAPVLEPATIAAITDLVDGAATVDERQRTKQPDWSYDAVDSGQSPADRIDQGVEADVNET